MDNNTDFVVLQVLSNEISSLDLNKPLDALFGEVTKDVEEILKLADVLVSKYKTEVFISEKPPRYEPNDKDRNGVKAKLSEASNALLVSKSISMDRVHVISQGRLACNPGKQHDERYQTDGIHLTPKGVFFLNNNWITKIKEVFTDIVEGDVSPVQKRSPPSGGVKKDQAQMKINISVVAAMVQTEVNNAMSVAREEGESRFLAICRTVR